jgi:glycosyltransferase involved in cell wall biosynthesis
LAKSNHIDYLTTGIKELPKYEVVDGIHVHRVHVMGRKELSTASMLSMLTYFPSSLIKGIGLCRKNNYDVINTHFVLPSGPTGLVLSKMFKIPLIMSVHGGDIYDPTKKWSPHRHIILRALIKWILNRSDKVTAQSNNTKNNTKKFYNTKKEIKIIPLGFVRPTFANTTREELGLRKGLLYLISVGRVVKRKGYEFAIQALSKLANSDINYIIIGEGPELENLKKLAGDLNLHDNVIFLGFVSEERKFQYLSQADIYVLSSLHEGFGICLLEAMYCSLPIVATNYGGQTDFLIDGRNALMVPIKDINAMSKKILMLVENEKERFTMAFNNKEDVKGFYIEQIGEQYLDIFNDAIISAKKNKE